MTKPTRYHDDHDEHYGEDRDNGDDHDADDDAAAAAAANLEAVGECLRAAGYDAHLNPTGKAREQFAVRDKTVKSGRISVPELMNYAENRKQNCQDIFAPDAIKQRHLFDKGDDT